MPEDLNSEIAESLSESRRTPERPPWEERIEIVEAILLAIVAVATAWSGYQAAQWDGRQAELYAQSSTMQTRANRALTLGGQQKLLDVSTFNTWIQARAEGKRQLTALYERRFSPEFKRAFDAWIALDPFSNPDAPPGPGFMPEYVNPLLERGASLDTRGSRVFHIGVDARHQADEYVRTTVVLATVLFLLALSQRFRIREVRIGVVAVAIGLIAYGLISIATFQRL